VVGAGFSGTLTAVRILRAAVGGGWRVILLERRSRLASIILEPTLPYFDS
jgi:cation diffusion facilitator CzcD-associated flavoprotein CzcO